MGSLNNQVLNSSLRPGALPGAGHTENEDICPSIEGQRALELSQWVLSTQPLPRALWPLPHTRLTAMLAPVYRGGN